MKCIVNLRLPSIHECDEGIAITGELYREPS